MNFLIKQRLQYVEGPEFFSYSLYVIQSGRLLFFLGLFSGDYGLQQIEKNLNYSAQKVRILKKRPI